MPEVTITVRGEHEVRRAPEEAVAHITVGCEGPDRGAVVERIAALAAPVRDDLAARQDAGGLTDWSSQRVSVWTDRPWNAEGKLLAPVHHASVEFTATFTDVAALSWWLGEVAARDGVQVGEIDWRLTRETRSTLEREAATHAVHVAVERATAYAQALGMSHITPVELSDASLHAPAIPLMRMAAAPADDPGLALQPDDIVVAATVEARFTAR
ncbi:SIMPL domain-containing protein [Microbacterium luticocti]|uniref:SIMPL domain-containing protein n=1 Tax=Microbacterium luticocti TaxID=451764 RepID=UPI0003F73B1D|nr:SIMPL domain-containing protein [Microbacterium luticocti]